MNAGTLVVVDHCDVIVVYFNRSFISMLTNSLVEVPSIFGGVPCCGASNFQMSHRMSTIQAATLRT